MGISRRSLSVLFFVTACFTGLAQSSTQAGSSLPKSFHDDGLDMTFFYPAHFELESTPESHAGQGSCVRTILSARSGLASGTSTFSFSSIDNTCPDTLRAALTLGPFTRQQIVYQLKGSGKPAIIHEPARYAIDGRSAAITLASATLANGADKVPQTLYAAKACVVDSVTHQPHKNAEAAENGNHVLCFDFTTQNRDLFSMMLSFVVQFGDDAPQPLFLSSVYPNRWSESDIGRR